MSQGAGSALKLYIHIGDMNAALSETRSRLSVVPVSEKCPCRLYFSVAIHSQPWAKVVLKDSPSEHPGTSPRNSVPVFRGWKVYLSVRLRTFRIGFHLALCLPPLLLPSPSFSSLRLLNCTLVLQACALDGFPSLPHTSPFFISMREECAAQFLVVKISPVSSGQTSPYCGSYATLC